MKNKALAALAALVLLFGGFTSGFFLGRNTRVETIQTTKVVYETVPVLHQPPTTVPTEPAPTQTVPPVQDPEPQAAFPVNINTADLSQLMTLPGIGEVIGQRIIDYRSTHGPFGSVDELINVKGIGEKRLAELKPYATV